MRKIKWMVLVPMAVLAAACGRSNSPAVDDALKTDLALASQAQPYNPQQVISPTEAGVAAQQQFAPRTLGTAAPRAAAPVRRTSAVRRSTGSSRANSGGGGYYPAPAPQPRETIVKHTQRDAAVGAVAGAVIGATTSRNKVRGGLIGAAVGGILGGVLGNNVDKQKKVVW
jgi:hypothetical protein